MELLEMVCSSFVSPSVYSNPLYIRIPEWNPKRRGSNETLYNQDFHFLFGKSDHGFLSEFRLRSKLIHPFFMHPTI